MYDDYDDFLDYELESYQDEIDSYDDEIESYDDELNGLGDHEFFIEEKPSFIRNTITAAAIIHFLKKLF